MSLIEESFKEIFPSLEFDFDAGIKYSGHFNGYNANIRLDKFRKKLIINMSKQWRGVDREIKKGLIQELLCKMFKKKANTTSIELYNIFIKQVSQPVVNRINSIIVRNYNHFFIAVILGWIRTRYAK